MNNKILIAIASVLIVACLSVGIIMNINRGKSEKEINSISNTETVSFTDESSAPSEASETNANNIKENEESQSSEKSTETADSAKKETGDKPSVKASTTEAKSVKKELQTSVKTTKKEVESSSAKKQTTTVKSTEKKSLTVSFSVNCEKAVDYGADYPKYLISKTKCTVKEGTTVFDLLTEQCSKNGIALVHQNKSYIKSIGGLSEKACGNGSGWTYIVNGVKPMMSASKYVLKDGDVVEWYYVTSPTD